jgi:hypothetical protein
MSQDSSPISQTPLSQYGKSLQAGLITAAAGVATNPADFFRSQNQAKVLNNLQQTKKRGIWTNRNVGWKRHRATAFNAGAAFLDFAVFVDSAAVETLIFQVGDKLMSYDIATFTETNILTGLSATALPCMRNFQASAAAATPLLIYVNGDKQSPLQITAMPSTSSNLFLNGGAGPAFGAAFGKTYDKPTFCEQFYNRMVYAGFTGASTSRDILVTNSGTPATASVVGPTLVATDGGVFQIDPKLGVIRGVKAIRINNLDNDEITIIGCVNGVALITGTSALDFRMVTLTKEYGILSNRAWIQLQNDLYFLSTNGIRRFSSLVDNATLLNASLTLDQQDLINRINPIGVPKTHATHNLLTQEVQFWFPIDQELVTFANQQSAHALIMNYNSGQGDPNTINPIWSTKDGTGVACSIRFGSTFFGGGYDGFLQVHYTGQLYDTSAVSWEYVSPLLSAGNPLQGQSLRKIGVITEGGDQKWIANSFVYEFMDNGTMRRSQVLSNFPMGADQVSGTVLGSWVLGDGSFPSEHVKVLNLEPEGNGRYIEVQFKGVQSDHIIDFIALEPVYSVGGTRT